MSSLPIKLKPWPKPVYECDGDYRNEVFLEEHIGGPLYQQYVRMIRVCFLFNAMGTQKCYVLFRIHQSTKSSKTSNTFCGRDYCEVSSHSSPSMPVGIACFLYFGGSRPTFVLTRSFELIDSRLLPKLSIRYVQNRTRGSQPKNRMPRVCERCQISSTTIDPPQGY